MLFCLGFSQIYKYEVQDEYVQVVWAGKEYTDVKYTAELPLDFFCYFLFQDGGCCGGKGQSNACCMTNGHMQEHVNVSKTRHPDTMLYFLWVQTRFCPKALPFMINLYHTWIWNQWHGRHCSLIGNQSHVWTGTHEHVRPNLPPWNKQQMLRDHSFTVTVLNVI